MSGAPPSDRATRSETEAPSGLRHSAGIAGAWTPGPWFSGPLIDGDNGQYISIGQYELRPNRPHHYEDCLCEVWDNPNLEGDPTATARLIAAAPEMAEALQTASWLLADISPDGLVKKKIDAVLAKIGGIP